MTARASVAAVAASLLLGCSHLARAEAPAYRIVVAMRYLIARGVSHAHLYLYSQDGKLIRQLTSDNSGQDREPVFAPDGRTVAFRRTFPNKPDQVWSIDLSTGRSRRLSSAPAWYAAARESPYFSDDEPPIPQQAARLVGAAGDKAPVHRAPDGSVEIVLRLDPASDDDRYDLPGHGKHYTLRYLDSGRAVELGSVPGFEGLFNLLFLRDQPDTVFLMEGPLRLAFFGLHQNSTDGDTSFALDLKAPRLVRLSPNYAVPYPLPGEPAFMTFTFRRYLPIPGATKTANCSYVERWNAQLRPLRYARNGPGICYGATVYRPGRQPAVINVRAE